MIENTNDRGYFILLRINSENRSDFSAILNARFDDLHERNLVERHDKGTGDLAVAVDALSDNLRERGLDDILACKPCSPRGPDGIKQGSFWSLSRGGGSMIGLDAQAIASLPSQLDFQIFPTPVDATPFLGLMPPAKELGQLVDLFKSTKIVEPAAREPVTIRPALKA